MILFVFEGAKREPDLFRAIETLFFQDKQNIVCSFGNNIYELYNELQSFEGDGDIVSILKERYQGQKDSPFTDDAKSSDFSEIYLIFDYDFQNKNISLDVMNSQLEEMLDMFDDALLQIRFCIVDVCWKSQEFCDNGILDVFKLISLA